MKDNRNRVNLQRTAASQEAATRSLNVTLREERKTSLILSFWPELEDNVRLFPLLCRSVWCGIRMEPLLTHSVCWRHGDVALGGSSLPAGQLPGL